MRRFEPNDLCEKVHEVSTPRFVKTPIQIVQQCAKPYDAAGLGADWLPDDHDSRTEAEGPDDGFKTRNKYVGRRVVVSLPES